MNFRLAQMSKQMKNLGPMNFRLNQMSKQMEKLAE
jgi:hypothetical protein